MRVVNTSAEKYLRFQSAPKRSGATVRPHDPVRLVLAGDPIWEPCGHLSRVLFAGQRNWSLAIRSPAFALGMGIVRPRRRMVNGGQPLVSSVASIGLRRVAANGAPATRTWGDSESWSIAAVSSHARSERLRDRPKGLPSSIAPRGKRVQDLMRRTTPRPAREGEVPLARQHLPRGGPSGRLDLRRHLRLGR
jgi:hypothetical protein